MKSKEQKRAEADARQEAHDELVVFDKLAKLGARPGESKRERARLLEKVAA